jgi:hypothetical protein
MFGKSYLDWKKLAEGRCPQCGDLLELDGYDNRKCFHCGFFCYQSTANKVIMDLNFKKKQKEAERLSQAELHGCDVK